MIVRTLLTCLLFAFCFNTKANTCEKTDECIAPNSWEIGIALGLGFKTNPLVDADNVPLIIIPDIAWYGKNAYLDNTEIGYQWRISPKSATEIFVQLDTESANFSFLHPSNLFESTVNTITPPEFDVGAPDISDQEGKYDPTTPVEVRFSIDEIAKRKWAVNGGVRWHSYVKNGEFYSSIQSDISNVHQGYSITAGYKHYWLYQKLKFRLNIGAHYKSEKLVDYYYGIDEKDTELTSLHYQASASFEPYLTIGAQANISESWVWLTSIGYRHLPSAMTHSPLVEDNYIARVFTGVAYRF